MRPGPSHLGTLPTAGILRILRGEILAGTICAHRATAVGVRAGAVSSFVPNKANSQRFWPENEGSVLIVTKSFRSRWSQIRSWSSLPNTLPTLRKLQRNPQKSRPLPHRQPPKSLRNSPRQPRLTWPSPSRSWPARCPSSMSTSLIDQPSMPPINR